MQMNTGNHSEAAHKTLQALRAAMQIAPQNQMEPQTSLAGARAGSTTPQSAPPQTNANRMNAQTQGLQQQGMGTAQAVNQAAQNPQNQYAQGGPVTPPPDKDHAQANTSKYAAADLDTITKAVASTPAGKDLEQKENPAPQTGDKTEQMLQDYGNSDYQNARAKMIVKSDKYAKGGPVESMKNLSLKDIIKLLASHPGLGGQGPDNSPMQSSDMKQGGGLLKHAQKNSSDPLASANGPLGGYAEGGSVPSDGVQNNDAGATRMATGGQLEADSITSYAPDGTPIIQNADGSSSEGDINQLLGRPESAPTLGTGQDPTNSTSKSAGNSIGQSTPSGPAQNVTPNAMAKGGEEGPPPGSLSKEVADDIPAKLSEGEFVFSADSVRYYGLRVLNALQDHARQELAEMANEGGIRSPGDGKNPDDTGGKFMQDQKPNMDAYSEEQEEPEDHDDEVTGLLKECMGGAAMEAGGGVMSQTSQMACAAGGGISEESFAEGGPVGGSPQIEYAKGGIVGATMGSLTPKKNEGLIPSGIKLPTQGGKKGTGTENYGLKKLSVHAKKGGLIDYNGAINKDTHQSYEGA